jgi:hypothetical protein
MDAFLTDKEITAEEQKNAGRKAGTGGTAEGGAKKQAANSSTVELMGLLGIAGAEEKAAAARPARAAAEAGPMAAGFQGFQFDIEKIMGKVNAVLAK